MKKIFLILLFLMFIGLASIAGGWLYLQHVADTPGTYDSPQMVIVQPGSGLNKIAGQLADAGVIAEPLLFRVMARLDGHHQHLKAGEYLFGPGMTPRQIEMKMVRGEVVQHSVTIPEGLMSGEIIAIIASEPLLTGEMPDEIAEGSLLPDTYFFLRGESRTTIMERMRGAMDKTLAEAWAARASGLPLETPEEALTLASIVEKETGIASERPEVAAVFINRLRIGMKLQSDPTTIYGRLHAEGIRRQIIRKSDLEHVNPYNTYVIDGLPPHPIAHPGRAAIGAVLHPADSDALYFVADGNGGHRFAASLAEHNRNVAQYRAMMRHERGDK